MIALYTELWIFACAKTRLCSQEPRQEPVTAQLISALVFATQKVQLLFILNLNFFFAFFCDCTGRIVSDLVGNSKARFLVSRLHYKFKDTKLERQSINQCGLGPQRSHFLMICLTIETFRVTQCSVT